MESGRWGGTCSVSCFCSVPAPPSPDPQLQEVTGEKWVRTHLLDASAPPREPGASLRGQGGRCWRLGDAGGGGPAAAPDTTRGSASGTAAPLPPCRLPPAASVRQPFRTQTHSSLNSLPTTAKDRGSEGLDNRSLNRVNQGPHALLADRLRPSFRRSVNPLAFSQNPDRKKPNHLRRHDKAEALHEREQNSSRRDGEPSLGSRGLLSTF